MNQKTPSPMLLQETKVYALAITALVCFFIVAYWVPLKGIVHVWMTDGDYSYGFLIPIITAYLLWDRRDQLRDIRFQTEWKILPLLLFFVALSLYGILGSSANIARPVIPLLILCFSAFCFGMRAMKKLFFPLAFLVFMVPLPAILDRTLGVFLKHISSKLGGLFIHLWGISVHVSGNIIDLGVTQLQVVDACSGLRFVFPLLALSVIYAYFFEKSIWKRTACVLAAFPIAVFANGIRIGVTGILTENYGSKVAEGFFHGFSGWIIFLFATLILVLLSRLLRFFPDINMSGLHRFLNSFEKKKDQTANSSHHYHGVFISLVLLSVVGLLTLNTHALPSIEIKGGIQSFPLSFSGWEGRQIHIDPEITEKSGAEEAFHAIYIHPDLGEVSLYMGYRSTAFLENVNFFHTPTVCLPGAGWKNKELSVHTIDGIQAFETLHVSKMLIERLDTQQLVYYWFQTKSKASFNKNINRLHLSLHALRNDNTHDLFIRPITPIKKNETIEKAEDRLDSFVKPMMEELIRFLEARQYEHE